MSLIAQHPRGYWLATTSTLTTEIAAKLGEAAQAGIAWGVIAAQAGEGKLT
jgi:hypothetical protein